MTTMYETIMDLPLLKGISAEQVSAFLEKTHVQFLNYKKGDRILRRGDLCSHIKFVISGEVRLSHSNLAGNMIVSETMESGSVIQPEYLFGMKNEYSADATALGQVAIMQFSKEQYFRLLQTDMIYMLNLLNYLSLHSQRPVEAVEIISDGSLEDQLALWVMTMTEASSRQIEVKCTRENLRRITNLSDRVIDLSLKELKNRGLIAYSRQKITILSRASIIEAARNRAICSANTEGEL